MIDRKGEPRRPEGMPIMHQTWSRLLFMHWAVAPAAVQAKLPRGLTLDTYEGKAWVSLTPFSMSGVRPPFLPALPLVSRSLELNVRTYVIGGGTPGVWFFSLDASNPLAVIGARAGFGLPYYHARMELQEEGGELAFRSRRLREEGVELEVRWRRGRTIGEAAPGSLEYFLVERYSLFASRGGRLYRARIHHAPWQLCQATLSFLRSSMLSGQRLPGGEEQPLVHAQGAPLDVEVWPLERIGTT